MGVEVWMCVCVCEVWGERGFSTCVFLHNMPKFHRKNEYEYFSAFVCAGSFISSPIAGTLFPLCLWISFKSLIITTVTSGESMWKWRPAGVFFSPVSLSMSDTMEPSCFSFTRPWTMPSRAPAFQRGRPLSVTDWQTSFSCHFVWALG